MSKEEEKEKEERAKVTAREAPQVNRQVNPRKHHSMAIVITVIVVGIRPETAPTSVRGSQVTVTSVELRDIQQRFVQVQVAVSEEWKKKRTRQKRLAKKGKRAMLSLKTTPCTSEAGVTV